MQHLVLDYLAVQVLLQINQAIVDTVTKTSAGKRLSKILRTQSNGYLAGYYSGLMWKHGLFSDTIGNHFHLRLMVGFLKVAIQMHHTFDVSYDNNTRGLLYANSSNYIGFLDPNQNWIVSS